MAENDEDVIELLQRQHREIRGGDKEQWFLLHKDDEHARAGWAAEDHPRSVKSGRTNDEVAAAPTALWHSDRPAADAEETVGFPAASEDELAALGALGTKGRWLVRAASWP